MSSIGSDGGEPLSSDEASASETGDRKVLPLPIAKVGGAEDESVVGESPVPLTEADLDEYVPIELKETETFWLFDLPGSCVAMDSVSAGAVKERNDAYEALLKKREDMADLYVEREAQTFTGDQKNKDVQCMAVMVSEAGTQATNWDIFDTELSEGSLSAHKSPVAVTSTGTDAAPMAAGSSGLFVGASGEGSSLSASGANIGSSIIEGSSISMAPPGMATIGEDATAQLGTTSSKVPEVSLRSLQNLPAAMRVVERMVAQNAYHTKHLAYRNIGAAGAKVQSRERQVPVASAALEHLWGFTCESSEGRNVSCVEWNPDTRDLLAVGYGEFDFSKQRDGLILFWSLKNPVAPDKTIKTPSGVTAIAFSSRHSNLLAVGLYDGTVCIYDVRKQEGKPMLESAHMSGKHTDPVWQLKWVDQSAERGENLVSISTDGRVTQWQMKKGLEHVDLMLLKRVAPATKQAGTEAKSVAGGASEGIISRRASGLCIDFSLKDPNIYIAGTEDGHIHKCSCSYNEQHLDNFFGHSGPVYKLRWSPFCPNTFLSCSADWTIKLWNQERHTAILSFSSTTDYVADICWSPNNSTVFASVTGDGRIDVWDISVNQLDPLTSLSTGRRLSSVAFSNESPVLVVGHEGGTVDVYSLKGDLVQPLGRTTMQQKAALDKVTTLQDGGH